MKIKNILNNLILLTVNSYYFVTSLPTATNTQVFHSQIYPNYSVSFKSPKLCDSVLQYSGYIDVAEDAHYFFWFFESRTDPDTDPFTIWLNGGPGQSSLFGLFEEIGPCQVTEDGIQPVLREKESWNDISNLLFIDQPSNTGLSYVAHPFNTTEEATRPFYIFLQLFFEAFPKYKKNDLHIFGESYGGHYAPAYADYILKQNQLNNTNSIYIPLKSIGIGNGLIDPLSIYEYKAKMACDSTYGRSVSIEICDVLEENIPICKKHAEKCYETKAKEDCVNATWYCLLSVDNVYASSGKSLFDVRVNNLEISSHYVRFLNQSSILDLIGAKKYYLDVNPEVDSSYRESGDRMLSFTSQIANLLNNGIRVLSYVGDADFICNWFGNYAWTTNLDFNNNNEYQDDHLKPWYVNGVQTGEIQQGGGFTFIKIYKAGHTAIIYQPEASHEMFKAHVLNLSL